MTFSRRAVLALALTASASAAVFYAPVVQAQDKKEITIGATAGSNIEVLRQGIKPLLEKTPDHYMLVLAVKGKDRQAPWTLALADAFRAPEFKAVLVQKFPGYARPAFLQ